MAKSILLFDLDGTLTNPAQGITNSFVHALKYFGLEIPSYEKLCTFIGPPLIDTFVKEFGFTLEQANEGVKKYREYFATKGLFENEVYDGIPELLATLKDAGFRLFIATSKPEEYSIRIAEHYGFAKYFEKICGSNMDETRSKKGEVIEYALQNVLQNVGILQNSGDLYYKTQGNVNLNGQFGAVGCDTSTGRQTVMRDGNSSAVGQFGGDLKSQVLMIGDRYHDIVGAKENGIDSCGVLFGYGTREELENAGATYIAENVSDLKHILIGLRKM